MLSQRVSLFSLDYLATGSIKSKVLAEAALLKLKNNHIVLTSPHFDALSNNDKSPLSETVQTMYFSEPLNVHESLIRFESAVKKVIYADDIAKLNVAATAETFLNMSRHALLDALNKIVSQYERESLDRVNELRLAQNVVLGIIILTILIEAVFVFRPMVASARRIQHDVHHDHLTGLLNRRAFYLMSEQVASSHSGIKGRCVF